MSKKPGYLSRRTLLRGAAATAGTLAASRLTGQGLLGTAHAQFQGEKSAVVLVVMEGGYNALFSSPDSFAGAGTFGVTAGNMRDLGNGLFVDNATYGTLPAFALQRIAAIGVRHGISDHGAAQQNNVMYSGRSAPLTLASAMGGDASLKAAVIGPMIAGNHAAVNGVSLQRITDTRSTIAALGGAQDPTIPDRAIAAKGLVAGQAMSMGDMGRSTKSLRTMSEGYPAVIDTLTKPVKPFDYNAMAQAYGIAATDTSVGGFTRQMLAAELMITAGTNVVVVQDESGWDTHGDRAGTDVRNKMTQRILPGLRTFLNRMLQNPDYNVTLAITGDFARSLPGSDHASVLSATVIGKYVRVGTTGKVSATVGLPQGSPTTPGLWAYLAELARAPGQPFGANPHGLVLAG